MKRGSGVEEEEVQSKVVRKGKKKKAQGYPIKNLTMLPDAAARLHVAYR